MRPLLAIALLVSCSSREAPDAEPPSSPPVFGDDRVADVLRRDPARAPRSFAEHEAMFGVGRRCVRRDSREIYVVEERATRFDGVVVPIKTIVPRALVTGCNPRPEELSGVATSYGLFSIVAADPARDPSDPLAPDVVEVMALDRTTGLYNFYVFDPQKVTRVLRDARGVVRTVEARRDGTIAERSDGDARCFRCHVHGEPIMGALADPWTSWVSTRSEKAVGRYVGETASIVGETNQLPARASFANALEPIVRNAIRAFVFGAPGNDAAGLGASSLASKLPSLLRSVFCETTVQWASTFDTVPLQLFVDPGAAAGSGLSRPISPGGAPFPQLLPIRSEIDQRIEEWLVTRGVLRDTTVRAIRLVDDANDVFSSRRCALFDAVARGLPTEPSKVDAHVRAVLRPAVEALPKEPRDYALALLDGAPVDAPREAFFAKLRARVDAELSALSSGDASSLAARVASRRAAVRALFPGDAHPIPFDALP